MDPGGLSPVDPATPVPGSGTLALAVFLHPHPAIGKPSGPRGQGASLIIEKTFNGAGATYKKRIKTFNRIRIRLKKALILFLI